jgi:hypothetical protein
LPEIGLKVEYSKPCSEITPAERLQPDRNTLLPNFDAEGTPSLEKEGGRRLNENLTDESDLGVRLIEKHQSSR